MFTLEWNYRYIESIKLACHHNNMVHSREKVVTQVIVDSKDEVKIVNLKGTILQSKILISNNYLSALRILSNTVISCARTEIKFTLKD